METVKEFFDAIKGQLAERLANPFTGAFCIAWVIWNFRLLVVFAGKGTYQEKFAFIDGSLYLDWRYWLLRGLVAPVATAAIYLWAYPRATRWLAEDYRKQQTKANNLMKAAEGAALLSVEESRALRTKYAEAEQAWNSQRDALTAEVDAQKETAGSLAKQNSELRQEIAALRSPSIEPEKSKRTDLVFSELMDKNKGEDALKAAPDDAQFQLSPNDSSRLPSAAGDEIYTRLQLQLLSILRDGARLTIEDFLKRLKLSNFEVQRALDRLRAVDAVAKSRNLDWFITETGRALLGAFVDSDQWNFAREGF